MGGYFSSAGAEKTTETPVATGSAPQYSHQAMLRFERMDVP